MKLFKQQDTGLTRALMMFAAVAVTLLVTILMVIAIV